MRSFKTPFSLQLTNNDVFGEAVGENYNNNNFKNEIPHLSLTPPEQQDEGGSWTPNGVDHNAFASALMQQKEVLDSCKEVNQSLLNSVAELTAAVKELGKAKSTVNKRSHSKKIKRYKEYVLSFLNPERTKKQPDVLCGGILTVRSILVF